VALVLAFLLGGLVAGVQEHPIAWLKERWRDLTAKSKVIPDVKATAVREGGSDGNPTASRATDEDRVTAWVTPWSPGQREPKCGEAAGIVKLQLNWSPAQRVDQISIRAGLSENDPARGNQFQPKKLHVEVGGQCMERTLEEKAGAQKIDVDVADKVTTLTLSIASVYKNEANPPDPHVAIRSIRLLTKGG
jgi:hypothetical protein